MNGRPISEPGDTDPSTGTSEDGAINYIPEIDEIIKQLEESDGNDADDGTESSTDPDENSGVTDPISERSGTDDTIVPKGSDDGSSTKDILMGIGIITIIMGILAIVAFMSVRRNRIPEWEE